MGNDSSSSSSSPAVLLAEMESALLPSQDSFFFPITSSTAHKLKPPTLFTEVFSWMTLPAPVLTNPRAPGRDLCYFKHETGTISLYLCTVTQLLNLGTLCFLCWCVALKKLPPWPTLTVFLCKRLFAYSPASWFQMSWAPGTLVAHFAWTWTKQIICWKALGGSQGQQE